MDVRVAGGAEGGGVGTACDGSGSLLANLAEPDTVVPGGQLVRPMDLLVAAEAEKGRVRPTEEGGHSTFAGVAGP